MEVEYKNIDPKLIVSEIRNGRSIEAVQKLFGLRFKSEVQDLYMKGLMELGEIPPVGFGKKRATPTPSSGPQRPDPLSTPPLASSTTEKTSYQPTSYRGHQAAVAPVVEYVEQQKPEPVDSTVEKEKDVKKSKPVVIRRRERKPGVLVKTNNVRTIGQSGSITLNKSLLIDQLGFSVGDAFEIYREDDRIILQKIELNNV